MHGFPWRVYINRHLCTDDRLTSPGNHSATMNTLARWKSSGKTCHIDDLRGKYPPGKGSLLCIDADCKAPVFAKNQGKKRAHHFAHYPTNGRPCCSGTGNGGESEEHLFAKRWIAENFKRLKFPRTECMRCWRAEYFDTRDCTAEVEGCILSSKFRADVLLRDKQGVPRFAIEVFHTHCVDTVKAEFCEAHNIQILEIKTDVCQKLKKKVYGLAEGKRARVTDLVHPLVKQEPCEACSSIFTRDGKRYKEYQKDMREDKIKKMKDWIQKGFEKTEKFLKSDIHRMYKGRPRVDREKLQGKCPQCDMWLVHDKKHFPVPLYVSREQVGSWKHYNVDWYRRKGKMPREIRFCSLCVTQCVRCGENTPVETLKRHGCCRICCTVMNEQVKRAEEDFTWWREERERKRLKMEMLEKE